MINRTQDIGCSTRKGRVQINQPTGKSYRTIMVQEYEPVRGPMIVRRVVRASLNDVLNGTFKTWADVAERVDENYQLEGIIDLVCTHPNAGN